MKLMAVKEKVENFGKIDEEIMGAVPEDRRVGLGVSNDTTFMTTRESQITGEYKPKTQDLMLLELTDTRNMDERKLENGDEEPRTQYCTRWLEKQNQRQEVNKSQELTNMIDGLEEEKKENQAGIDNRARKYTRGLDGQGQENSGGQMRNEERLEQNHQIDPFPENWKI